jgi:hypothetical protein
MDLIFDDFRKAYEKGDGYGLSQTLSPIPPPTQPQRLYNFFRSTNFATVQKDFKYQILYSNLLPFKLPVDEGNGWVEVYHAYWKAVGEILNAENAPKSNTKVIIIYCSFLFLIPNFETESRSIEDVEFYIT